MFKVQFSAATTEEFYAKLKENATILLCAERDWLANSSNLAALIGINMPQINWAGFYLLHEDHLRLGPFWGLPACTRILLGQGVCGTAVVSGEPQLIDDVTLFEGHIACDAATKSELVIPLKSCQGRILGVLDIDSPSLARFTKDDLFGLTGVLDLLVAGSDWEPS